MVSRLPSLDADENGLRRQEAGLTAFSSFESETDDFGFRARKPCSDLRVRGPDAVLAQLRSKGANVVEGAQDIEGSIDSAGSPILRATGVELWQRA